MKRGKLFQTILGTILIIWFIVGCSTPTAMPVTSTVTPTQKPPTFTPTSAPTFTPTMRSYCSDPNPEPGLFRLAAERHITIGTFVAFDRILGGDRRYCEVMLHDFNLVHVEEFSHPDFYGEGPGKYNFGWVDVIVDYANQQGWRVRGSHLIWGYILFLPDWLKNRDFTRDEYIGFLETHIKTLVGHFKGRVQEWNIANEVVDRDPEVNPFVLKEKPEDRDFWMEKIGPEYIEMAFRWAREADPDAKLILNGCFLGIRGVWPKADLAIEKTYQIVKELNSGPDKLVDGVGMQMHFFYVEGYSYPPPTVEDLLDTMKKFADLGVDIYITEMDVDVHLWPGTQQERYVLQAEFYRNVLTACLRSGACASFATQNIYDLESLIVTGWCVGCKSHSDGGPLMFDRLLNPKPAYFAVRDVLAGH